MKQMTVRDIPDDVESVVRTEAALRGVSLNKAILTLLKRGAQQQQVLSIQNVRTKGRFKRFCGLWSDKDAAIFDYATDKQRTIDNELWQ